MFTGIIQAVGTISAVEPRGGDLRLRVSTGKLDLSDVELGDSGDLHTASMQSFSQS